VLVDGGALSRELQQIGDDDRRCGYLALRGRQVPLGRWRRGRSQVTSQQVDRVRDHSERVAELMPNGRGQLPDRSEPLLTDQLFVCVGQLGQRPLQLGSTYVDEVLGVLASPGYGLDDASGQQCGEQADAE